MVGCVARQKAAGTLFGTQAQTTVVLIIPVAATSPDYFFTAWGG